VSDLKSKVCTPCRGGIPPLTAEKASAFLSEVAVWKLIEDATKISKTFQFQNFRSTYNFVQQISELAESEGHHPVITFGWGFCTVYLQTKKIKGLHENDFIMAAKINALL